MFLFFGLKEIKKNKKNKKNKKEKKKRCFWRGFFYL
jgi:hypothetical protein